MLTKLDHLYRIITLLYNPFSAPKFLDYYEACVVQVHKILTGMDTPFSPENPRDPGGPGVPTKPLRPGSPGKP
jgi:hypothetical protein